MMHHMRTTRWIGLALIACAGVAQASVSAASATVAQAADGVNVTVTYTGKGEVDARHRLWIWLFDSPNIGPGAMPVAELSLDKNGDTAAFSGVTTPTVWIAIAYDEQGGFAGSAPPPPGSPVTLHMDANGPIGVTPGPTANVTITFDDSQRMR